MLSGREKAAKLEKSLKKMFSDPGMAAKLEKSPEKDVFSPGKSG